VVPLAANAEVAVEPTPRVWTVFVSYLLTFVFIVAASAVLFAVLVMGDHGATGLMDPVVLERIATQPAGLIGGMLVSSGLLAASALLAARLSPTPLRQRLSLPVGRQPKLGHVMMAGLGAIALGEAMMSAATLAGLVGGGSLELIAKATSTLSPGMLVVVAVVGSVGPGLGEELFFRGYMQTRLRSRWGARLAIAITGFAFGLIHLDPLHAPIAGVLGLYFGWLAERWGSITITMVAHTLNNAVSFLANGLLAPTALEGHEVALLLGSLVVAGGVIAQLFRASRDLGPAPESPQPTPP
jgi:membrane protease YdiL (CAAX protease family)